LNDKLRVSNLGTTRTGMEAVVQSIVDRVLQGDSKGIVALTNLFNKAKLFKPVPNPTRLSGVVIMPPDYWRDQLLGVQKGYYPVPANQFRRITSPIQRWTTPDTSILPSKTSFAKVNLAILAVVVKANAIWRPCWRRYSVKP